MKKKLYLIFQVILIALLTTAGLFAQRRSHPDAGMASRVIVPADGSTTSSIPLRIVMKPIPGSVRYTLELSTAPDFSGHIIRESSRRPSIVVNQIEIGNVYYARVKTNRSGFGKITSFRTVAVSDVTVSVAGNGTQELDYSLLAMRVEPQADISMYSVAISPSADFRKDNRIFTSLYPGQNEFVLTNLQAGKKYFLRASGDDGKWGPVLPVRTQKKAKSTLLWGVTTSGGTNNQGTIFSFDPETGRFEKHLDYQHETEWIHLAGSLIRSPEGLAALSIIDATGGGELFTLKPDGSVQILESYGPHNGSVMLGSDNFLYVVDDWINVFQGGIYKIHSAGDDVFPPDRIIYSFEAEAHGNNPVAQLVQSGLYLFGNAPSGGFSGKGTLFRGAMDGSDFDVLHHFNGNDGETPSGALVKGEDGFLYGVTEFGGSNNAGVVYRVREDGTAFQTIFSFAGTNGHAPKGSLLWHGGKLYGTTSGGGHADMGVIFQLSPDGSGYTVLHSFSGSEGSVPLNGLSPFGDKLFGMTSEGGAHNLGVIFEIRSDGSGYTPRFDFSEETGGTPDGVLLPVEALGHSPAGREPAPPVEKQYAGIFVYPNPFRDSFQATLNGQGTNTLEFIVTDMSGNLVIRRSGTRNVPLELGENLEKGLYVLKIRDGNNVTTQKLIKH